MKKQITTNTDQSERLIACGVNQKTADFVWMDDKPNNPRLTLRTDIIEDRNPYIVSVAWSLSSLIELLPPTIEESETTYYLDIVPFNEKVWGIGYFSDDSISQIKFLTRISDLIECCVEVIESLLKNGYNLKTDNK